MFKFAHIADCHLGSWNNHPELNQMPIIAFEKALNDCIEEKVDFILIAGDLFDTAIPPVDVLRRAVSILRKCKEKGVRIYAIAGSHDFSPTGRTMLHVLEDAGLITYIAKYDEHDGKIRLSLFNDPTGAKICGIVGKKGSLDIESFDLIDKEIENIEGFKIFMFHSAISELRPKNMETMAAVSLEKLPKNFDYYATGHVHVRHVEEYEKGYVVFPSSLFPTEFTELERYDGGYFIITVENGRQKIERREIKLFDIVSLHIKANGKTPSQIMDEIINEIETSDIKGKALLIKVNGILSSGKPSDVDFKKISNIAKEKGAFTVKKNTSGLESKDFEEIKLMENMSTDEIERKIIKEHLEQMKIPGYENIEELIFSLIHSLKEEKAEDENNSSYESRIIENAKKVLGL